MAPPPFFVLEVFTEKGIGTAITKKMIANRKQQILETVMLMLEDKQTLKITTASIAKKLNISEAALYRHFSSKRIFIQLVDFIETSLLTISSKFSK